MVQHDLVSRIRPAFDGRRVLVTGGASFIGSHLVELLVAAGAIVTVADDLSSGRREHLATVEKDIRFHEGDLRDPELAQRVAQSQQTVFHLAAAHGGRGYIESHPVEMMNNLLLDHSVLAGVVQGGAERVVYASSACVYPTTLQASEEQRLLLREDDAGFEEPGKSFPDGDYGWSKFTGERQLWAFQRQYGTDAIACRLFTAYGERENESHAVIALIAKAVAQLDPFPVWGDGLQTRNFTYVGDTVAGLALAGAELTGFQTLNVGTDAHHTVRELNELIFEVLGWRPNEIDYQLDKPVGVKSRAADCERCRELLKWAPAVSLGHGIRRTTEWYLASSTPERLAQLDELLMTR